MAADVKELISRHERMLSWRMNYERDWRLLAEYLMPTKLPALQIAAAPGQKKTTFIYDSEGMVAPSLLAANLQGNLVNPSQKWFSLEAWPEELNEHNSVQNWNEAVAKRLYRAQGTSNFSNVMGEFCRELPVFGTAGYLKFLRPRQQPGTFPGFVYESMPIGTYCIQENDEGRVDTVVRKVKLNLRAAKKRWGDKLGPDLLEAEQKNPDRPETFVHWIYPRTDRNPERQTRAHMPWASVWIYEPKEWLIDEGGYQHNPLVVTRWMKATGELWGTGQGHMALPDIRTLNRILELKLAGIALAIAPPLAELEGQVVGETIWEPAAINIVRTKDAISEIPTVARIDYATLQEDRTVQKIRQVFFTDQIQALPPLQEGPPGGMSELEVAKRYEQVFRTLGPMYGRLHSEWLQPEVENGVLMLWNAKELPEPPQELLGGELHIKYEGPMSRAQLAEELTAIVRKNQWAGSVVELTGDRAVLDNFDYDEEAQVVSKVVGLSAKITRGKDTVGQIRQQRAQAMEQQQKQQQMAAMAEGAQKVAPLVKALKPAPQGQGAAA